MFRLISSTQFYQMCYADVNQDQNRKIQMVVYSVYIIDYIGKCVCAHVYKANDKVGVRGEKEICCVNNDPQIGLKEHQRKYSSMCKMNMYNQGG